MRLYNDRCEKVLAGLAENSVDAVITDPPAGIGFMGQEWDGDKGGRLQWVAWMEGIARENYRVLKPGGWAVVWSLPRTSHWTAWAWENAGFEVRDRIAHVFGSGFPKSRDIGKAIDKEAGEERKVIRTSTRGSGASLIKLNNHGRGDTGIGIMDGSGKVFDVTAPATPEAAEWEGWGTALKPAVEDWWLFRKPLSEKTVAKNVLKWGTGALNIEACRVPGGSVKINKLEKWSGFGQEKKPDYESEVNDAGRWPANLIHDGSDEVVSMFPEEAGGAGKASGPTLGHLGANGIYGKADGKNMGDPAFYGDTGSAARFFYCAKPSQAEKNYGLDGFMDQVKLIGASGHKINPTTGKEVVDKARKNTHSTVKPLELMKYLIRLTSRPGGVVLDSFMGSGTTMVACKALRRDGIGIEMDSKYYAIAAARVAAEPLPLFSEK